MEVVRHLVVRVNPNRIPSSACFEQMLKRQIVGCFEEQLVSIVPAIDNVEDRSGGCETARARHE
jgi:hypothetical protein